MILIIHGVFTRDEGAFKKRGRRGGTIRSRADAKTGKIKRAFGQPSNKKLNNIEFSYKKTSF